MLKIQKASAGSGKTYMLTYEYIKLLLGYTDDEGNNLLHTRVRETHRSILAITFTNKATEEMKQRIVKELAILASEEKVSPYMQSLCEWYRCKDKDIHRVAKRALWELLNDFSMFNISTIDSFFQVILRTFAREAEVIYNYDIELHDEYAVHVGINNMLSSLSRNNGKDNKQLIAWLNKYMQSNIDSNMSWDIFKAPTGRGSGMSLYRFARNLSTEVFKNNRDAIKEYLSTKANVTNFLNAINKKIEYTQQLKVKIADSFAILINEYAMSVELMNKKGPLVNFEKIKNSIYPSATFFTINDECKNWFKKEAGDIPYGFVEGVLNLLKRYNEYQSNEVTYLSMINNIYALGLLGDIDYHIEEFRKENDLILLSDTNDLLKKIISEDDAPFIYERIGVALKYFLIDEFQDTSRLQWENMRALLAESLSHNQSNLIIGDEKQSIYRFRNADPSLLQTQVYQDFNRHISSDSRQWECSTNWRSSANVIKFNNTLFSILPTVIELDYKLPQGSLSTTYNNVVQYVATKNKDNAGSVKVDIVYDIAGISFATQVAQKIPMIIEEYLNKGYKQRDIAILLNKRSEAEEIIENILSYSNTAMDGILNIVSDESLFLVNSPSVKLIISILRHIDSTFTVYEGRDGTDTVNGNLMPEISRQYEQFICAGRTPSQALSEVFANRDNGVIEFKNFETMSTSLVTIVESIIKEYITVDALKKENAYIQAFQDVVISYSSRHPVSITLFLKWWDSCSSKLSIASSSDIDAINIMTIHKSKGLEFPCVIIPNCNWDINKDGELLWAEPKLVEDIDSQIVPPLIPITLKRELQDSAFKEEYQQTSIKNIIDMLNKTYVAFTRAAENLYILTPEKSTNIGTVIVNTIQGAKADKIDTLKLNLESICDASSIDDVLLPLADYMTDEGFSIGKVEEIENKDDEVKKNVEVETFEMEDYLPADKVENLSYDLPDTLTSTQREKGNLYHTILSKIRSEKEIDLTIRRARARGILLQHDEAEIRELLERGLQVEEVRGWFAIGNRVMNERPIGNAKNIYRPDRIIVTPHGSTIIVDYKFGAPAKSYHGQIANYIKVLKAAGFANVIGKLWYPLTGVIETIE